jgi:ectoine hydroxylase-related dioxygenase (phytanoyl-CoA dioxygenase family)
VISEFTESQIEQYREDGFLIVEDFLQRNELELIRTRIERWLEGDRDMVLNADDSNWLESDKDSKEHRVTVGLWKGDSLLGKHIFSGTYAKLIAQLEGLESVRFFIDHLEMKPEGGKPLEMHQDGAVNCWIDPAAVFSCWVALDDTYEDGGTLVYVRGSHRWGARPPAETFFKAVYGGEGATKWTEYFEQIAPEGTEIERVPVVVKAGGAAFHSGWTWHGSGPNTRPDYIRRSYVVEMTQGKAQHHPVIRHPVTSRVLLPGETELPEKFFPIVWSADGYRTPWIETYGEGDAKFISAFSPDAMTLYEAEKGEIDVTPWATADTSR